MPTPSTSESALRLRFQALLHASTAIPLAERRQALEQVAHEIVEATPQAHREAVAVELRLAVDSALEATRPALLNQIFSNAKATSSRASTVSPSVAAARCGYCGAPRERTDATRCDYCDTSYFGL